MKIISKFKDYYDFLSGKYGIDPKVVLDRRTADPQYKFINIEKGETFRLYICGRLIEGVYYNNNFYYGDDLSKVGELLNKPWHKGVKRYYLNTNIYAFRYMDRYINAEILKDEKEVNKKENCPIILENSYDYYRYPILSELKLAKFIPAETIYNWLVDWISDKNEENENRQISMTDIQKLEAKGFDKKISFRNVK